MTNCKGCIFAKNVKCVVCGSVMSCTNPDVPLEIFRDIIQGLRKCEEKTLKMKNGNKFDVKV